MEEPDVPSERAWTAPDAGAHPGDGTPSRLPRCVTHRAAPDLPRDDRR